MPTSNQLQSDLLKLLFNATSMANLADNAATSAQTFLFVGLHTADPTAAGTANSSEATYTGYTRVAVSRASGAFAVSGSSPTQVAPVAAINFPACTAGTNTVTHFSISQATIAAITCTAATPGVFTWTAHGLSNGMPFYFQGTAPTGLTANTIYYVKNAAANTFEVSATPGGGSIATSSTGSGLVGFGGGTATKLLFSGTVAPNISVSTGVTPSLTTASTVTEA